MGNSLPKSTNLLRMPPNPSRYHDPQAAVGKSGEPGSTRASDRFSLQIYYVADSVFGRTTRFVSFSAIARQHWAVMWMSVLR